MESVSQESLNKPIDFIQNFIKRSVKNSICNSYIIDFNKLLLEELSHCNSNEILLKNNLSTLASITDCNLQNKCKTLEEEVKTAEISLIQLETSIHNFKVENSTEKDALKARYEQKRLEIVRNYSDKFKIISKELDDQKLEHIRKEKELRDEIALERASKNIQLNELRVNLQKQILELNSVLCNSREEHKLLQKELGLLKREQKPNKIEQKISNIMTFNNENIVKQTELCSKLLPKNIFSNTTEQYPLLNHWMKSRNDYEAIQLNIEFQDIANSDITSFNQITNTCFEKENTALQSSLTRKCFPQFTIQNIQPRDQKMTCSLKHQNNDEKKGKDLDKRKNHNNFQDVRKQNNDYDNEIEDNIRRRPVLFVNNINKTKSYFLKTNMY